MKEKAGLQPAATVILIRDREDGPYEVFLMRRSRNQSFMGGAFVFPGGRLEEGDCEPDLLQFFSSGASGDGDGFFSGRLEDPGLEEAVARGLHCAAVRETFEEAGILLAVDESGRCPDLRSPEEKARFAEARKALSRGDLNFKALAARERLRIAPDLLIPYAHWITPQIDSKRFDTRFFLALLPEGQSPIHDEAELTASVWLTPEAALAENAAGRIVLMPPTLKTLHELLAFRKTADLLAWAAARPLHPILPQFFQTEKGGIGLRLPFDPDYTIPEFKLPPRPGEPSRLLNLNNIWTL